MWVSVVVTRNCSHHQETDGCFEADLCFINLLMTIGDVVHKEKWAIHSIDQAAKCYVNNLVGATFALVLVSFCSPKRTQIVYIGLTKNTS